MACPLILKGWLKLSQTRKHGSLHCSLFWIMFRTHWITSVRSLYLRLDSAFCRQLYLRVWMGSSRLLRYGWGSTLLLIFLIAVHMWEQFFSSRIFWVSFSSIFCLGPIKLVSFLQSGLRVSSCPINFLQISLTSCRCWDYRVCVGLILALKRYCRPHKEDYCQCNHAFCILHWKCSGSFHVAS